MCFVGVVAILVDFNETELVSALTQGEINVFMLFSTISDVLEQFWSGQREFTPLLVFGLIPNGFVMNHPIFVLFCLAQPTLGRGSVCACIDVVVVVVVVVVVELRSVAMDSSRRRRRCSRSCGSSRSRSRIAAGFLQGGSSQNCSIIDLSVVFYVRPWLCKG